MVCGAVLCAAAHADQPPASPPPPPRPSPTTAPDEGLLEFLGADDVADSAWSEYLKRAVTRKVPPPPPPPQGAKP
jgi:hypothetical protein